LESGKVSSSSLTKLSDCFLQLINIIIYEKEDDSDGWVQLHKYFEKEYEAYQHLLILKSCADLMKFDIDLIKMIDCENMQGIPEEEALLWPKPFYIMYRLCKALLSYCYYLHGISGLPSPLNAKKESRSVSASTRGNTQNRMSPLEKIEESEQEEEEMGFISSVKKSKQ